MDKETDNLFEPANDRLIEMLEVIIELKLEVAQVTGWILHANTYYIVNNGAYELSSRKIPLILKFY